MDSRRNGYEIDLRIADCEFLNQIDCPKTCEDFGHSSSYSYQLSQELNGPTLHKFWNGTSLEFIDLYTGQSQRFKKPKTEELSQYFWVNGHVAHDKYYITPDGILRKDTETKISEHRTFGKEYEEQTDAYHWVGHQNVFCAGKIGIYDAFAFVDDMCALDEKDDLNNYLFVRLATIDFRELDDHFEQFSEPFSNSFEPLFYDCSGDLVTYDCKVRKNQASRFSFAGSKMATITKKGKIKIFDIKAKKMTKKITPLKNPELE